MKSLLILITGLFLAGCATTEIKPVPTNVILHNQVLQADKEWDAFIAIEQPSDADAVTIAEARDAYDEALQSGDQLRIERTARDYIAKVAELMMPPIGVPPRK